VESRNAMDAEAFPGLGAVLAPLVRQFWMIALIVTVGALASLAFGRLQEPLFEATALVQVVPGVDVTAAEQRLTGRDSLTALAMRHHLVQPDTPEQREWAAQRLRQAVTLHPLTAEAGQTLGYDPQQVGIVVSVRLNDAETSAKVANDLAQQIVDAGAIGRLDENRPDLEFYRRDEERLWQEISALRAEQAAATTRTLAEADAVLPDMRRLMLMNDQYQLVRQKLAEGELAARLSLHKGGGKFSLLRRASSVEAVNLVGNWMLVGVAGSLLLAVTLAFVLERRYPALQQQGPLPPVADVWQALKRCYLMFDDPARPILGVPRYAVISALIVVWLYVIAAMFR
jgi:uncharacterized protein involved in exopolysaccharide biosynthesis